MIGRQSASAQRGMNLVQVTRDVVALIMENEAQDVEGGMLLGRPEVAGLVYENAELAQQRPEMQSGGDVPA